MHESQKLYLIGNQIGDEGAKALAKALEKTNAPLQKLYLWINQINKKILDEISKLLEITKNNIMEN